MKVCGCIDPELAAFITESIDCIECSDDTDTIDIIFFIPCKNVRGYIHGIIASIHDECIDDHLDVVPPDSSFTRYLYEDDELNDVRLHCLATCPVPMRQCKVCQIGCPTNGRCSTCDRTYYCSKECQLQDWPLHKVQCPEFKTLVDPLPEAAACPCYSKMYRKMSQTSIDDCAECGRCAFSKCSVQTTKRCTIPQLGESPGKTHCIYNAFCSVRCRNVFMDRVNGAKE